MSISAIGAASSAYANQNINSIKNTNIGSSSSPIAGAVGQHHGGGKYLQDIMQALQNIGLNIGNTNSISSSSTASSSAATPASNATTSNVKQALGTFLYDLHQALNQAGSQQNITAAPANNVSSGSNTNSGYGSFATNVKNLVSTLNSNSASATSIKLQTDFQNLINTSGSTASGSGSTPSLQGFLQQLQSNASNMSFNQGVGSIFSTKV